MTRFALVWVILTVLATSALAEKWQGPDLQPLAAQASRVTEAMDLLGSPVSVADRRAVQQAAFATSPAQGVAAIQKALDKYVLLDVTINPESRVKVAQGPAKPELVQGGWRVFLVKVNNQAGVTAKLRAVSPNAVTLYDGPISTESNREYRPGLFKGGNDPVKAAPVSKAIAWLDMRSFEDPPLKPTLSGLGIEYRILQLYSKDSGQREAKISLNVGQGTQDLGFRSETDILFNCLPSRDVSFRVLDEEGKPATAMFIIRDSAGRVYPSRTKRLAPDFAFHPQVYRASGEKIQLPRGTYTVDYTRGPEYVQSRTNLTVADRSQTLAVRLKRWIDPSKLGWWSGDHHIHAAGCSHYTNPSAGVLPPDMMRHCMGEDLKVGCNLTWGPCFDYQKQFFTGKVDAVSQYPYLLRYDVEVSGFGSHQAGHLCLLRLKEEIYPGGDSYHHWPTLCLNTLKWAKKQGAVCGPAHSGWGLTVPGTTLPSYVVPPMDSIGAIEYVVDVTHTVEGPDGRQVPAVDFMSTVDTPYVWELNMWYHTLNCGYRTRISGETDFPCIYGERVGLGRSYVKLDGKLDFDSWTEGIRQGRCYVSDGRSHLIGFQVNGLEVGSRGSEIKLSSPGTVKVSAQVSALLAEKPFIEDMSAEALSQPGSDGKDGRIQNRPYPQRPYWHLERARIGDTREVPVELIVNGEPVAKQMIVADGTLRPIYFDAKIDRSSWVALRIMPSSHTNPVWVMVGDQPVRASKRSAEWCLASVDQCWKMKERTYKLAEHDDAVAAYNHARDAYRRILSESDTD